MSGTSQSSDSMIPAIFFKFSDFFVCLNDFFPELSVFTDTFLFFFCVVVCFSHYFLIFWFYLDQNMGAPKPQTQTHSLCLVEMHHFKFQLFQKLPL